MMLILPVEIELNLLPMILTGGGLILLLGIIQLYLGLKAQNSPDETGEVTMLGDTGPIVKASSFRHRSLVEIRGELWWCRPSAPGIILSKGDIVEVVDIEDDSLILRVRLIEI